MTPDELTLDAALALLAAPKSDEPIGELDGFPVFAKNGRYGPYVQWGSPDQLPPGLDKPKMASLFKTMVLERLTMDEAEALLSPVGQVRRVPEGQQDAVTALSGSGPAYFFFLVEAMIDAGILLGLPRAVAADLIVQTAYGSAVMLRESGEHPVQLREAVTSPGGTTIAAIRELERHGVRAALIAAIEAAHDRSVALGRAAD